VEGAGEGVDGDPGRFERWLADPRVDEAARSRARRHWLRSAAEEDASFAGVLLDLAERDAIVAVTMASGRHHHGELVVVGDDFIALRNGPEHHVVLRRPMVAAVRSVSELVAPVGDREVRSELHLVDVLIALAADRSDASLQLVSGDAVAGEVRSVGVDVVVLRSGGPPPTTVYASLDAVVEVALDGPLLGP
jgi:hypothetical protein